MQCSIRICSKVNFAAGVSSAPELHETANYLVDYGVYEKGILYLILSGERLDHLMRRNL